MLRKMKTKIKKTLSLVLAVAILCGVTVTFATMNKVHAAENTNKVIDLYVIAGQSNAVGFTQNPADTTFNSDVNYYAVTNTQGVSTGFTKVAYGVGSRGSGYFGPEIGIANAIAESTRSDREAVIYKYAIGGTYLYPKAGQQTWANELYENWKTNLKIVVEHYKYLGYSVNLVGTYWMQGEADSDTAAAVSAYEANLTALINKMRADYRALNISNATSAPFVIGKIAENYGNKTHVEGDGVMTIRAIQDKVAATLSDQNVIAMETARVAGEGGDNYHFGTAEALDVGKRAGETIIRFRSNSIILQDGASVRISDPTGIRFSANITEERYAEIIEDGAYKDGYQVGMIIVPKAYFDDFKSQSATTDYYDYFANTRGHIIDLKFDVNQLHHDAGIGVYNFYGSIVNIKDNHFELDYQAVAYVKQPDGTYKYSNVSDARNIIYVATKAIEDLETTEEDVRKICDNYGRTYSTVTVTAGGSDYTVRTVGDVTLQDVSDAIQATHGKRIVAFDGKEMTETLSGSATGAPVALNGTLGSYVTFNYMGAASETITATLGKGLEREQSYSGVFEIPSYKVDFKDLANDLTITYSYKYSPYAGRLPVTIGEKSCTLNSDGLCSIYLNTDFTDYKSFTISATRDDYHAGIFLEDENGDMIWIVFRPKGDTRSCKVFDSYPSGSPNAQDTDYTVPLTAGDDISVTYDGSDLWLSAGEGVGTKGYKLTEFLADNGYTIDLTKIKSAGLWGWSWATTFDNATVSKVLTECEKGNHTDEDGDHVCDLCGDGCKTTVTFKYADGTEERITATYGKGLEKKPTVPSVFEMPDYTGDFKDLTGDLTVTYSYKYSPYAGRLPVTIGEKSCTFNSAGLCSIYLNTDFTDYKSFTISATRDDYHAGIFLEDENNKMIWIVFRPKGNALSCKVFYSYPNTSGMSAETGYYVLATAGDDISVTYDGADLWLSAGEGVGTKAYKLTEFLAGKIDLTKIKSAGLWGWSWATTFSNVTVNGVLLTECEKGNHTDEDDNHVCDLCGYDWSKSTVTFNYVDGTTETITATYGVGLEKAPTVPANGTVFAVEPDYTGDFKDLANDLTVTYSYKYSPYAGRLPVTIGEKSCTLDSSGLCSIYLNTDFTDYKSFTISATRDDYHAGIFLEDENGDMIWIVFRPKGNDLSCKVFYSNPNSGVSAETGYYVLATAGDDISVTYDGADLWLSAGEGVGTKAYKLTEFLAGKIDLTKIKSAGLWGWSWAATFTDVTVSGVLFTECEKGNHTDEDGDHVCDLCGYDWSKVTVTFKYVDGTTETITATYGVGLEKEPTVANGTVFAVKPDYTGDFTDLTADLTVTYDYVKTANLNGVYNSTKDVTILPEYIGAVSVTFKYHNELMSNIYLNQEFTAGQDFNISYTQAYGNGGVFLEDANGEQVFLMVRKDNGRVSIWNTNFATGVDYAINSFAMGDNSVYYSEGKLYLSNSDSSYDLTEMIETYTSFDTSKIVKAGFCTMSAAPTFYNIEVTAGTESGNPPITVTEKSLITYSGVEDRRDPYVLVENGVYYMYTTGYNCYVNRSGKLDGTWTNENNPGSTYAGTVVKCPDDYLGCPYAPEVHKYNGMYYMFTSYQSKTTGKRGCTILRADNPLGPFEEITGGLLTPADWFCIDGTFYVDKEDQPWMIFTYEEYMDKRENSTDVWNSWGTGKICAAKLSEDLTHFISDPVVLFEANDAPWVRPGSQMIADAPWLYTTENGSLLMLWSSLAPSTGYTVGIARSTTGLITGPWIHEENTLAIHDLTGKTGGHAMIFEDIDGQMYLSIHSPNSDIEIPVFIKIREENDTLVWDLS